MGGGGDGREGECCSKFTMLYQMNLLDYIYIHGHIQVYFQAALHVHVQGLTGGGFLPPPLAILIVVTINSQLRLRNSHLLRFFVPIKKHNYSTCWDIILYTRAHTRMNAHTHTHPAACGSLQHFTFLCLTILFSMSWWVLWRWVCVGSHRGASAPENLMKMLKNHYRNTTTHFFFLLS